MKKILLLLLLLSPPIIAKETLTLAAQIPEQAKAIEEFVPTNWKIEGKIDGDLNKDTHIDTVLELIQKKPSSAEADLQRLLVIVFKHADNSLHKAAVAEKLLLCPSCFGMMGTNANITIEKGVLVVEHLTGSRETQELIQRFRYEEASKRFVLIGEDIVTNDRMTLNGTSKSTNFLTGEQIEEITNNHKSTKKTLKIPMQTKFIEEIIN